MELFLTRLWGNFPGHTVPPGRDEPDEEGFRHMALVLAYQGSAYAGWQYQPGEPTLQGAVEKVLSRLCGHELRVHASGRTDAGVHAFGQVVSFATRSHLPLEQMLVALRSMLGQSIYPVDLLPVAKSFHARYSALAKTYDYYLAPAMNTPAFVRPLLWGLPWELDEKPLRHALMLFSGRQDLRALSTGQAETESTVRDILEARLDSQAGLWRIRLTAQGFLRHVVRNLVGILVQIGRHKITPAQLGAMLRAGEKLYPAPKAPASGLYLNKVYYHPWPGPAQD